MSIAQHICNILERILDPFTLNFCSSGKLKAPSRVPKPQPKSKALTGDASAPFIFSGGQRRV